MTPDDFRRIALSLKGAEEGSHFGSADFRVGGRIFATLAAQAQGYGNLMLTLEQQATFVAEAPEVFIPVPGGWGRNGAMHLKLAGANEDLVFGALQTAWKLRIEKNRTAPKKSVRSSPTLATKARREDGARRDASATPGPGKARTGHPHRKRKDPDET